MTSSTRLRPSTAPFSRSRIGRLDRDRKPRSESHTPSPCGRPSEGGQLLRYEGGGSAPEGFRLLFHLREPRVVVRELVQMGERDLAGEEQVVAGHVGRGIAPAVLQLHLHAAAEFLQVDAGPVDPELVAGLARLALADALPGR